LSFGLLFWSDDRPVTNHEVSRRRRAGVARLVLTHLSTRYDTDPAPLARQAGEEFAGAVVAHDGLALDLPWPE